ncbi:unnamed protein product [Penicillium manginii]
MGQKASLPQPGTRFQIIGAGLPRTGTASLTMALETLLDGPIWHGGTQTTLGPPSQIKAWGRILRHWLAGTVPDRSAALKLIEHELDGYAAITDCPGGQLVPELLELYPTAKVICTVRDPIKWEKSLDQAILLPLPGMRHFISYCTLLRDQWVEIYGEAIPTRQTYIRHISWLKEVVPEDRLVFFDVRDGWEPLCEALDKEVPKDLPFPHVNDGDAIGEVAKLHVRRGLTRWAIILTCVAAAVAYIV